MICTPGGWRGRPEAVRGRSAQEWIGVLGRLPIEAVKSRGISVSRWSTMAAVTAVSALCLSPVLSHPAAAGTITDPANDFLISTFTGTPDPSLDVLSLSADFDGSTRSTSARPKTAMFKIGST
jgi:hypothetical protein